MIRLAVIPVVIDDPEEFDAWLMDSPQSVEIIEPDDPRYWGAMLTVVDAIMEDTIPDEDKAKLMASAKAIYEGQTLVPVDPPVDPDAQ